MFLALFFKKARRARADAECHLGRVAGDGVVAMSSVHTAPTPGALCLLWWLEPKAGPAALLGEEEARNHLCYAESPMARAGLGPAPPSARATA